jgi:hypothetical protein
MVQVAQRSVLNSTSLCELRVSSCPSAFILAFLIFHQISIAQKPQPITFAASHRGALHKTVKRDGFKRLRSYPISSNLRGYIPDPGNAGVGSNLFWLSAFPEHEARTKKI